MNARFIRIKKECRALFWPWCAVTIAGALPLVLPQWYSHQYGILHEIAWAIIPLVFFAGFPLLATLSFGNEFQYRTLPLLLSQPTDRMQIWGEKLIVTFVAVLSTGVVSGYAFFSVSHHSRQDLPFMVFVIVNVIDTMAAATFSTLVTRSTIGGMVMSGFIQPVYWGGFVNGTLDLRLERSPATIPFLLVFGACFAGMMLWLGGRKLARYQVTGGIASDDLLMAGPTLMPEALAGWFRSRPGTPFLNLIRKELRLLRPLWLITLLIVLYMACMAMLRLVPNPAYLSGPKSAALLVALVTPMLVMVGLAILAGSLSLGEERMSGTQLWHMTLPLSARSQWLLKLGMAVFAGLVCSALLPLLVLIAGGSRLGSPFMFVDFRVLPYWLLAVSVLAFASFWCACAVNGTVRAAIWVIPAMIVIALAMAGGEWLGEELTHTTGTLSDLVVSSFHLTPLALFSGWLISVVLLCLFVPVLLLAVIQSYRLFRTQPQDGLWWMMRCLLPLAVVALLSGLAAEAGFSGSKWAPFSETALALEKRQPIVTKLELTADDLAKGSPLSAPTRRWLRDSSITVDPHPARSGSNPTRSGFVATIHLAGGLDCRLSFEKYPWGWLNRGVPLCVHRGP